MSVPHPILSHLMAALKFKLSNQHTRQVSNLKPFLPSSGDIKMDLKNNLRAISIGNWPMNNLRASCNKQNFKKLCNEQWKQTQKWSKVDYRFFTYNCSLRITLRYITCNFQQKWCWREPYTVHKSKYIDIKFPSKLRRTWQILQNFIEEEAQLDIKLKNCFIYFFIRMAHPKRKLYIFKAYWWFDYSKLEITLTLFMSGFWSYLKK